MTKIVEQLNALVSDHAVLYQKLRNYHWNVKGPHFFGLHEKLEELYTEMAETVDELAERVATLGTRPASTLEEFMQHTRLQEDKSVPSAQDMVRALVTDFRAVNEALRNMAKTAEENKDRGTANLCEDIADRQEKTRWMLESVIQA